MPFLKNPFSRDQPYIEITLPCKKDKGCSVIVTADYGFLGTKDLYCLDEPDWFCTCNVTTRKGKSKTSNHYLSKRVERKFVEKLYSAGIGVELQDIIEKSKLSKRVIKKLKHGEIKTAEELKRVLESNVGKLMPKIGRVLEKTPDLDNENYILVHMNGGKPGVVPYSQEKFKEMRNLVRYYVDKMAEVMKK